MTGATIIAKQNNDYYMVKVRHSGYDVLDIIPQLMKNKFASPSQLLIEYLNIRQKDYDDISLMSELDASLKKLVFHFKYTMFVLVPLSPHKEFEQALQMAHDIIDKLGDDSECAEYRCGYEDYSILIDFDNNRAYDDDKLIAGTKVKKENGRTKRLRRR